MTQPDYPDYYCHIYSKKDDKEGVVEDLILARMKERLARGDLKCIRIVCGDMGSSKPKQKRASVFERLKNVFKKEI